MIRKAQASSCNLEDFGIIDIQGLTSSFSSARAFRDIVRHQNKDNRFPPAVFQGTHTTVDEPERISLDAYQGHQTLHGVDEARW